MSGVEILISAETAGSYGFGVGLGTWEIGIGTVGLMGIGIGRRGGGGGRGGRMVRFGKIRVAIMNCINSHVYRA